MNLNRLYILLIGASTLPCFGQKSTKNPVNESVSRPKLVVGIVVDQMRYDFLYRYYAKYGSGGFKRMLREGYSFANCTYNYFPTVTGPGHASVFTGTTPSIHGIVANDWYDKTTSRYINCVQDDSVNTIGSDSKYGKFSPRNLKTYTVADQVKLATNFRGKTFGISVKDRGAILPPGHTANGAFWLDPSTGDFISSSFYRKLGGKLPSWLNEFNLKKRADFYKKKVWNTLLPIAEYTESTRDSSDYEEGILKGQAPVFPYDLKKYDKPDYEIVKKSPFGNTLTVEAAQALLEGENLGKGPEMDMLTISFSCTDVVGHEYGPNSIEVEDTYLRLDRDLEILFETLDKKVGKGQYLVFLTADHGVTEAPGFLKEKGLPGGNFSSRLFRSQLESFSKITYNDLHLVKVVQNLQIYLNDSLIQEGKLDRREVAQQFVQFAKRFPMVRQAFSWSADRPFPEVSLMNKYEAGYFPGRSGDIQLMLSPGVVGRNDPKGTDHNSAYSQDAHVPCLWMGWKIKPGEEVRPIQIQDIAPTLSSLLHIMEPNGCTGKAQFIPLKP